MPEGRLRSGVYRSFIMCDDPRGVVECGAITKQSKTRTTFCSTTNHRFDHPSKAKPKENKSDMAPRKSTEDAPPPSLQLLRVSKGIQKMNVAIESWSKGLRYDEAVRPEDIAKNLLRGALDLEESLAMLSSFQDEDIKQKPRTGKDGGGELRFQRSMSDRFGERVEKRMISQEKVASRDCYEELRKVIRESFQRQNLLSQTATTTRPNTRLVPSDFASSSGAASSSTSSQSSMVSGSTKSSASSDVPRRAPNLIARLMGMDVSPQEPAKIVNPVEKLEQLKKKNKESPEVVRCNSTRQAVLQSFPQEIPSKNPSAIVLIRPMRVVQPEMKEKPGNKMPVSPKKKQSMQGEVHPRMINQRKDHQVVGANSNKMRLPASSVTKKGTESKDVVRMVEQNAGKVIKIMSPSNAKAVTKDRKPVETNKKISVKKEDGEGKDRPRPLDRAPKKSNSSSDMSRNKIRHSKLSSSSSSGEKKSTSREKKMGEASRPKAKKKLHQQDNDLASDNNSGSSQDTQGSLNQLSAEETTSSEFHIQGRCENEEVSSRAAIVEHSHEPDTSQISLKSFLSTSQDFLTYAENLFDIKSNSKRSQESALQNRDSIVISDQKLALNYAKEVAKRRSLLLMKEPTCPQRSSLDTDELLLEVCDGFESLKSYRDTFLGQDDFVRESIHMVLEKDLESKKTEMRSGVWDLGWRSEFRIAETYRAVVDLEKLILSGLIHEIFLS